MSFIVRRALLLLLTLAPGLVFAADSVTPKTLWERSKETTDLSRRALTLMLGDVVNHPLQSASDGGFLGPVFFILNMTLLCVMSVYLGYSFFRKIAQGATTGAVLQGNANSGNSIIKTLFGLFMLIPGKSGWALSQLIFLWMASLGIGGANLITDKIADQIGKGEALYSQPAIPAVASTAKQLVEMRLCMLGINHGLAQMKAAGEAYESRAEMRTVVENGKGTTASMKITNGTASCGELSYKQIDPKSDFMAAMLPGSAAYLQAVDKAQRNATVELANNAAKTADYFYDAYNAKLQSGEGTLPDIAQDIQIAAKRYQDAIGQALRAKPSGGEATDAVAKSIKEQGWVGLGTYYRTLSTANSNLASVANNVPTITPPNGIGDVGSTDYYQGLYQAYQTRLQKTEYVAPLGAKKGSSVAEMDVSKSQNALERGLSVLSSMFDLQNIFGWQAGSGDGETDIQNPIIRVKEIGDRTMVVAETGFGLYMAAKGAAAVSESFSLAGLAARAVNFVGQGAVDALKAAVEAAAPMIYALCIMLMVLGAMMSVFIPLIPVINWIMALVEWFVVVLTGIAASTLWAVAHVNVADKTDDRSTTGYIFIIDVLLRPILMVCGFVFAMLILTGVGTLFDVLFIPAFRDVQGSSVTGLLTLLALLVVYARVMGGIIMWVFMLPIRLPNWVISWIGDRGYDSILGDAVNHVGRTFIAGLGVRGGGSSKPPSGGGDKTPTDKGFK
ncbi:TPA: DotA/TraY family protein [Raoultella ornithinolytica]|nr:DotA/TraY family protein [Raoultella ornithinolytica]HAT1670149.1 DotA/TraY family protein [Raoultella ornithinolytica]